MASKQERRAGLHTLADNYLSVPSDKGANAGAKVTSLVSGMVAGADSIDDMALMRHGAMGKVFNDVRAPSTLGSFLRAFTFGHARQLARISPSARRLTLHLPLAWPWEAAWTTLFAYSPESADRRVHFETDHQPNSNQRTSRQPRPDDLARQPTGPQATSSNRPNIAVHCPQGC